MAGNSATETSTTINITEKNFPAGNFTTRNF